MPVEGGAAWNLSDVGGGVGHSSGDGPVGVDPSVDAPVLSDVFQPGFLPLGKLAQPLLKHEVGGEGLGLWVGKLGEDRIVHLRLAAVSEIHRGPAEHLEALGDVVPGCRVELLDPHLLGGDPFHIPELLAVHLGSERRPDFQGREHAEEVGLNLGLLLDQQGMKGDRSGFIEGEPTGFLPGDDRGDEVFQVETLLAPVLPGNAVPEFEQDLYVLDHILVHFRGPGFPAALIVPLVFPETIPESLQRVPPDEVPGELPLFVHGEVPVL